MCNLVNMQSGTGETIRVADIKKKYIENIIANAHLCKYIKKIVLFGSSIREDCTDESDVDIAIFGTVQENRCLTSSSYLKFLNSLFEFDFSQHYDTLYFDLNKKYSDRILYDIEQGEVLYVH